MFDYSSSSMRYYIKIYSAVCLSTDEQISHLYCTGCTFSYFLLFLDYLFIIIKFFQLLTHPTYNTALFQYGRVSILSDNVCTQSMKKQQQGASPTITTNPANICQMPAIKQLVLKKMIPVALIRPRMMATEMNKMF